MCAQRFFSGVYIGDSLLIENCAVSKVREAITFVSWLAFSQFFICSSVASLHGCAVPYLCPLPGFLVHVPAN